MRKIIAFILFIFISLNANEPNAGESIFSPRNKDTNEYVKTNIKIDPLNQTQETPKYDENEIIAFGNNPTQKSVNQTQEQELDENEIKLMKLAMRNQNLHALQNKFFNKNYTGFENTSILEFEPNKTIKIRTRFAMATTLIFQTEIESYILGDTNGFKIEEIPNMSNAIAIKPMLIGIDTSLTIFTKDKKLHTFYLFSTDYKNTQNPNLVIYIKDYESKEILKQKQKELNRDYLVIKDGINELKIKKADIKKGYKQKAKKENAWLMSEEIFSDKTFTYFKYPKDKMPQIPTIFAVVDKQDSPVETRIIGDYIVAETISPKFTIKSGNSYICVEKIK